MTPIFADTYYFLALTNSRDAAHGRVLSVAATNRRPILTTWFVLLEVADAMCRPADRATFLALLAELQSAPDVCILDATPALLMAGVDLFRRRPDKGWSLTDCTSFAAMTQAGVVEAYTADRHFEQAGFVALLK